MAALNGIFFTLLVSAQAKRKSALNLNFLCELPGYILDKENDMTTCNKDELEKYSYTDLSYVSTIFTFALLPLVIILTMMKWQRFMQLMKVLFRKKEVQRTEANHFASPAFLLLLMLSVVDLVKKQNIMTILRWNLTVNEFIFVLELLFIFMKNNNNYYGQHLAYMCMYLLVLSFNAGSFRWRHGHLM